MGQPAMTHRDAIAIPTAVISMASSWWLPLFEGVSQYAPLVLTLLGIILAAVQIVYYVRMLRK